MKTKINTILFAIFMMAIPGITFSIPPSDSPSKLTWKQYNELYNSSTRFTPYIDSVVRAYKFCFTTDTAVVYESNVTQMEIEKYVEFVGGEDALAKLIAENIEYPKIAIEHEIEGKVILKFIVTENGDICNVRVVNPGGLGFAEEAIRILSLTKNKWIPAVSNSKKIKSYRLLPVSFKLK